MQKLGHEVGTGGCHQDGVGMAREVDVRHIVGLSRVPLRHVDRVVGQGLHRHGGDKLGSSLGHDHLYCGPFFDQGAAQLCGFVASDTPAQAQHDMFVGQITHGAQCSRAPIISHYHL